ncbi:PhnB protein [Spirosomataceae bacterium TFI 002]|nr:PhnB protein [Spirosomataceae bacterium TFI 002]
MASVNTYLNFARETEEAFNFYKSVFGVEFVSTPMRFGDFPPPEGAPPMNPDDAKLIMNIQLEILGGHVLMGTDAPETMGLNVVMGNNVHISLNIDSRKEADDIFKKLSDGGTVSQALQDMFWGAYWGSFTDKFGVQWMINCDNK